MCVLGGGARAKRGAPQRARDVRWQSYVSAFRVRNTWAGSAVCLWSNETKRNETWRRAPFHSAEDHSMRCAATCAFWLRGFHLCRQCAGAHCVLDGVVRGCWGRSVRCVSGCGSEGGGGGW